jgi:putative membrane protein
MKWFLTLLALAAGVAVVALPARAQQKANDDLSFVKTAALGSRLEVELGQLAMQQGHNPAVRDFGKRMVEDHRKLGKDITALAEHKAVAIRGELDKEGMATLEHFKSLKGSEFDQAYMKLMVQDHEKDVRDFTRNAAGASDDKVRAFAAKALPTLKEHLNMAREVYAKVSGHK